MIGPHAIKWDQFQASFDGPAIYRDRVRGLLTGKASSWDLASILIELLRTLSHLECKLAHDRVFGLYSILIRAGLNLPEPDYNRPVSHVFQEVVASFVDVTGRLTPLYMTLPADSAAGLPSWVPNWLTHYPEDPVVPQNRIDKSGTFADGYPYGSASSYSRTQAARIEIARGTIELKGTRISKINKRLACLPQEPTDGVGPGQFDGFGNVCLQWCRLLHLSTRDGSEIVATVGSLINCIGLPPSDCEIESWFHWMLHPDGEQAALIAASDATRPDYLQHLFGAQGPLSPSSTVSEISDYLEKSFCSVQQHLNRGAHYAFITLDSGQFGRAHYTCQEGDGVYLFAGCEMPLILRPHGDAFRVVAPAYIKGGTHGQLWPDDESTLETITLV